MSWFGLTMELVTIVYGYLILVGSYTDFFSTALSGNFSECIISFPEMRGAILAQLAPPESLVGKFELRTQLKTTLLTVCSIIHICIYRSNSRLICRRIRVPSESLFPFEYLIPPNFQLQLRLCLRIPFRSAQTNPYILSNVPPKLQKSLRNPRSIHFFTNHRLASKLSPPSSIAITKSKRSIHPTAPCSQMDTCT